MSWWEGGGFDLVGGLGTQAIQGAVAYEQASNTKAATAAGQQATATQPQTEQVVPPQDTPKPKSQGMDSTMLMMLVGGGALAALGVFLIKK